MFTYCIHVKALRYCESTAKFQCQHQFESKYIGMFVIYVAIKHATSNYYTTNIDMQVLLLIISNNNNSMIAPQVS